MTTTFFLGTAVWVVNTPQTDCNHRTPCQLDVSPQAQLTRFQTGSSNAVNSICPRHCTASFAFASSFLAFRVVSGSLRTLVRWLLSVWADTSQMRTSTQKTSSPRLLHRSCCRSSRHRLSSRSSIFPSLKCLDQHPVCLRNRRQGFPFLFLSAD